MNFLLSSLFDPVHREEVRQGSQRVSSPYRAAAEGPAAAKPPQIKHNPS
jgi:hypothetical protein